MNLSDFDYDLPEGSIAQRPVEPRDRARLLAFDRASAEREHLRVRDLTSKLRRGDLLVVNETRVLAARLRGRRPGGGAVDLLLIERRSTEGLESSHRGSPSIEPRGEASTRSSAPGTERWRALVKPAAKLRPGMELDLEGGALLATAVERTRGADGSVGRGWWLDLRNGRGIEGDGAVGGPSVSELLEQHGRMPLPPYIRRDGEEDPSADRAHYQTLFARRPGAVAAPTAGLHFTEQLLEDLAAMGVERTAVTLHVGEGTFRSVECEDLDDHEMHREWFECPESAVAAVRACKERGGRVIAVGTTSVRTLESSVDGQGVLRAGSGETNLFLKPGSRFHVIDGMLTNFHLPKSTLLMLVSAFIGRETALDLYREAIDEGYRFFSYGDAMLLT